MYYYIIMDTITSFKQPKYGILNCSGDEGRKDHSFSPGVNGTYSFHRPGLKELFPPDQIVGFPEELRGYSFGTGPLSFKEHTSCRWNGRRIRDLGIDIHISFEEEVFIDHIIFGNKGGDGSFSNPGISGGTVYARLHDDQEYRPVAHGEVGSEGEVVFSAGTPAAALIIHLESSFQDILLSDMEIWGSDTMVPPLSPMPEKMDLADQWVSLGCPIMEVSGDDPEGDGKAALDYLREQFREKWGIDPGSGEADGMRVIIEPEKLTPEDIEEKKKPLHERKCRFRESIGQLGFSSLEDFSIKIGKSNITVKSKSRRGLLYGAAALLQLIVRKDNQLQVPEGSVQDGPAVPHRGIHIGLPPREEFEFFKRLVRYLLVPCRYNTVYLEIAGGMVFEKHPEISEAWKKANQEALEGKGPSVPHGVVAGGSSLTKAEVSEICSYIKECGLEVIPEVQSLSHVQYLLLSHPEISEVPAGEDQDGNIQTDDARPKGKVRHCYCVQHPEARKLIIDMMDEILEAVKPERYVHLGHDEVYHIGECLRCRNYDKADLFYKDLSELIQAVHDRGYTPMIWADMLQPPRKYGTEGAIAKLSKDLVLLDFVWYFYMGQDIEDHLLNHDFPVVMGNLYSSHYPRFTERIRKEGIAGGEVSAWCRIDEKTLAAKGKLYDFLYTSWMLWDPRYNPNLRWWIDRGITKWTPLLRKELSGSGVLASASLEEYQFLRLTPGSGDLREKPVSSFQGIPYQMAAKPLIAGSTGNVFRLPAEITVPVGKTGNGIYFVHAAGKHYTPREIIGTYRILYSDGTDEMVPIEYGWNIAAFNRRHNQPLKHSAYRHDGYVASYTTDPAWQGKDQNGKDLTLYGFTWVNPHPDRKISEITLEASSAGALAEIYLWAVTLIIG